MICLCENNWLKPWQVHIRGNETYILSGCIWYTTLHVKYFAICALNLKLMLKTIKINIFPFLKGSFTSI